MSKTLRTLMLVAAMAVSACASAPQAQTAALNADSALHAPRLIPLQGARNFRDIGGYRTEDGRRVKWGLIYRSAELSHLTAADFGMVNGLGVRTVYDLRSTQERTAQPTLWAGADAPRIIALDYELDRSAFAGFARPGLTADAARAVFTQAYPGMLLLQRPQERLLFETLLQGEGATLYHCTAGKDRTGIATALILTALGVPREIVFIDYEMSNRFLDTASADMIARGMSPDVARVLGGVDVQYLQATLAYIETNYGSVDAYLDRELGVDAADIQRLRALYTE